MLVLYGFLLLKFVYFIYSSFVFVNINNMLFGGNFFLFFFDFGFIYVICYNVL